MYYFILVLSIIFILTGIILAIVAIDMFKRKNMVEVYDTLLNRGYGKKIAARKARKEARQIKRQQSYTTEPLTGSGPTNMNQNALPSGAQKPVSGAKVPLQKGASPYVVNQSAVPAQRPAVTASAVKPVSQPQFGATGVLNNENAYNTVAFDEKKENSDFEMTTSISYTSSHDSI